MHSFFIVGVLQKIGRTGTGKNGRTNVSFEVFCRDEWVDKGTGQLVGKNTTLAVTAFDRVADRLIHKATPGVKMFISGSLSSQEKHGNTGTFFNTSLTANEIEFFEVSDAPPQFQKPKTLHQQQTQTRKISDRPEFQEVEDSDW